MTTRSAKGNVDEKLAQAFACFLKVNTSFVLRLYGFSYRPVGRRQSFGAPSAAKHPKDATA
jgi:hypothetical protein